MVMLKYMLMMRFSIFIAKTITALTFNASINKNANHDRLFSYTSA